MTRGMTPALLKRLYYASMRGPMWLNTKVYAALRQPHHPIKVHLGPGKDKYVSGWVNVDANIFSAKIDLWADLRNALPFRANSVETFYTSHVIEHLPNHVLPRLFKDMYRALVPGGGIRIGAPDTGNACRKYLDNDLAWFSDFPKPRRSIGGRLDNFIFCAGEHLVALSETYLRELAEDAGFIDIHRCLPVRETTLVGPEILAIEHEDDFVTPHTVLIEARKPQNSPH